MTTPSLTEQESASSDERHFEFGRNWARFLSTLDDSRIDAAVLSMQTLLGRTSLNSQRFLDAGSGSGLFSLSAYRLGANVTSFDLDPDSVACTSLLKSRYGNDTGRWNVLSGSLTDRDFLKSLGTFDVVYCWGVAHHTGRMWECIENLLPCVKPGGLMVLSIYNDQQYVSKLWGRIKSLYQRLPVLLRPVYVAVIGAGLFLKRLLITLAASGLRLLSLQNPLTPFVNWMREKQGRGMHAWHDLVDWVGGWPFEVARPEDVFRFVRDRGFVLQELTTCGGHGCNEFVFRRTM